MVFISDFRLGNFISEFRVQREHATGFDDFFFQHVRVGQRPLVLRGEHFVRPVAHRRARHSFGVLGTENQPDGRIFTREREVFGGLADVEVHPVIPSAIEIRHGPDFEATQDG
jgi:hypothetical protein